MQFLAWISPSRDVRFKDHVFVHENPERPPLADGDGGLHIQLPVDDLFANAVGLLCDGVADHILAVIAATAIGIAGEVAGVGNAVDSAVPSASLSR